ncbi:family 43 glycosylhydrolase [Echinicola shivajiensis]|uniref:family 43 glycosylhydrolase n=1 Tax=Echinicola shivajiensis TaxID=1035916 RepID=UPI001BFBFAF9|nr:family 43 glycosylhydrolase [Echinicola shivajiensis]
MKNKILVVLALLALIANYQNAQAQSNVPAPLYVDPNWHGSCDPEVIYNPADQYYYIYYTSRRPLQENTYLGTPLGVIRSKDLSEWEFLGYCKFDGLGGTKNAEATYWAPAIVAHDGELHMFVTWKPDYELINKSYYGGPGKIIHYKTSQKDPVNGWERIGEVHNPALNSIDATVYKKDGSYHLWYKAKRPKEKNKLYHLSSKDMLNWEDEGFSKSDVFNASATGSGFEEAPYVFNWKGSYWLITDPHKGLFVYKSNDAENWKFQGTILLEDGKRKWDNTRARHPSVTVIGDRAFIFYHVEPWREYKGQPATKQPLPNRRSALQMAELKIENGDLVCDRDLEIKLPEIAE